MDRWEREREREQRETLRSPPRRSSVRTLFALRGRVTLVWALISLGAGVLAYLGVRLITR